MIPNGAQPIIAARAKRMRPAEMILVSLIGRINEPNHTIYAQPECDYEWDYLRGLQVCIYATTGIDWKRTAMGIAKVRPEYLALWDAGRNEGAQLWLFPVSADIEKPREQWRWFLDHLAWTPFENREFA